MNNRYSNPNLAVVNPLGIDSNLKADSEGYNRYGWAINPTTGNEYSEQELTANENLPLPKASYAAKRITAKRIAYKAQQQEFLAKN